MVFIVFFTLLLLPPLSSTAQNPDCLHPAIQHSFYSKAMGETRQHWVALPLHYSDTVDYPVIYVLDAEWRFDLVRHMAFDLGGNNIMEKAIIVGIPHIDWEFKRGIDLTFSHSRIEYDGEVVDTTWYNSSNSGGAQKFYYYFLEELIPLIDSTYSTNQHETLIGHSYGGYFGGYLLSLPHPFEVMHLYDPAIWYSDGEVIKQFQQNNNQQQQPSSVRIHLTYQPIPAFHQQKIATFIALLQQHPSIKLTQKLYPDKSHNALFLDSFYQGIQLTHGTKKTP